MRESFMVNGELNSELQNATGSTVDWAPLMPKFRNAATKVCGRDFPDYASLHRWSVEAPDEFWRALWDFDGIVTPDPPQDVLSVRPDGPVRYFAGMRVNYAAQILRHADAAHAAGHPAIIAEDERGLVKIMEWPVLQARAFALAARLQELGVSCGDRVAAYLPNRPEAIISVLACACIGAIWTICAPDMGAPAVLDRLRQIEPSALIATDGVFYAGKAIDRTETVEQLRRSLPGVKALLLVRSGFAATHLGDAEDFAAASSPRATLADFSPIWVSFDHPLWILYSSGTTGKPKALVHSHGGMLLGAAAGRLHSDLGASYGPRTPGERFHWFSSTGWMMWNAQINGLLTGATICIFDGSPFGGSRAQDWGLLWRFVARHRITFFGSGAQYFTMCEKADIDLSGVGDLSMLRALGSTASPLPALVQSGISRRLSAAGQPRVWWFNSSGGTDICGSFCTGNRELAEAPGKLQCRQLGAAVEAWDDQGREVIGEVGELVCTKPLPNMPVGLWGDVDGEHYREAYYDYFPGVWRHGDWIKIDSDGTCEIFGRSDTTINRGGHRMGTSEIYSAVDQLDEVIDSLVVEVRVEGGDSRLLLFVVTTPGVLSDALASAIRVAIRNSLSPRFLPDHIFPVKSIPRTRSSKRMELPVKRLFEGQQVGQVAEPAAMENPAALAEYVVLASEFRKSVTP